jgi:hypothetical protein
LTKGGVVMNVAMSRNERLLFESFVNCSRRYLEFGSGGSTWLAAANLKQWLITIDSSQEWLKNVEGNTAKSATKPETVFVDIGPVGMWGTPIDSASKDKWPGYHEAIWEREQSANADLYFVDGRFRVASAVQCLLHSAPGALIAIHDFSDRPQYHIIRELAREISIVERLSIFVTPGSLDRKLANSILEEHRYNPA